MSLKLKQNLLPILLFVFFSCLYIYTSAPGIYDGDSGEMAAAVNSLGLAHPTGFPLYMLMGKLFSLLVPIKDVAFRLNMFSSLLTAGAVVFVYLTLKNLGNSPFASLAAAFIFGLGTNTIWRNGSTTSIYALSLFFVALLFYIFTKWRKDKKIKYLYWYGFLWGLSLGTHTSMLIMGIPFLFMLWQAREVLRSKIISLAKIILVTITPGIQYIYLLFAYKRNGVVTWGSMASWNDFIYYITQRQYAFKMWDRDFSATIGYLKKVSELLTTEFTVIFFFVAIIGLATLFKKHRSIFAIIILLISANIIILLGYGKFEGELFILYRYIFISDFALAIAMAFGLDSIIEGTEVLKNKNSLIFFTSIVLLIVGFQFKYAFADNNRRNNYLVVDTAHNILNNVEPNSIILAYGDPVIGPLWYFQSIGERKDVVVISSPLVPFNWYINNLIKKYPDIADSSLLGGDQTYRIKALIENNVSKRPIYAVFNSSTDGELEKEFDFIPQGILYKLVARGTVDPKKAASANKEIWSKYVLRNLRSDFYKDNELKVMAGTYAVALYRSGLAYYYSGMMDEAVDAFRKSVDILPNSTVQKNLDYIINKKASR